MNGYYAGKVKVVCEDLMCFPARPGDLEPLACGSYDPYAWIDPDPEPVETIGFCEWLKRRDEQWRKTYNAELRGAKPIGEASRSNDVLGAVRPGKD
jgi:hypothetical protein